MSNLSGPNKTDGKQSILQDWFLFFKRLETDAQEQTKHVLEYWVTQGANADLTIS